MGLTTAPFVRSTTCPASLPAGSACTIAILFAPTMPGPATGSLAITASDGTHAIVLAGVGHEADGLLVSGTDLDLGATMIGTTSPSQVVTFTNVSAAPVAFAPTGSPLLGEFVVPPVGTCIGMLPLDSCTVAFAFRPTATGPATVTFPLDVTINGGVTSTHLITLSGAGVIGLTLSPSVLDFGDVPITGTSPTQFVDIRRQHHRPADHLRPHRQPEPRPVHHTAGRDVPGPGPRPR